MVPTAKLHPSQFEVNDAWILFRLNDAPIHTVNDGSFNFLALMDAASCFILGSAPVPVTLTEIPELTAKQLLKDGQAHKQQLPTAIYIPIEQQATSFAEEAKRQGITVHRVPEEDLQVFICEAKADFKSRFGKQPPP